MEGELKVGRYRIEQGIPGEGGQGVVYRARDTKLKRTVALKIPRAEVIQDPELRRRLAQEARAAAAITHPGVATVFEYEEHGEESFIVYEFVEGATLRKRLNEHRFTTEEILDVGIQLTDALSVAHDHGVVHRDMKPENIMLTPATEGPGRVKILDFGLAKLHQPLRSVSQAGATAAETGPLITSPGLLVGTVNYMSPEQLAGEGVDARTDLYGLGLVLYEMATGVNPFLGNSPTSTIANILTREPAGVADRNPVAPPELDRILRKCLRKRREERYQSARELQVDLANLRRDLVRPADRPAGSAAAAEPVTPLTISRGLARGLFLLIQVGYLVMYSIAFFYLPSIQTLAMSFSSRDTAMLVAFCALGGAVVRLYFLSAVGFDWPDTGRLFRQLFLPILMLDVGWALSPLLLFHKLGYLALLCIAGLAYLPFSQRALLYSAYAPRGGRTSGVKAPSSL